jgi:hypothetical protein
MTRNNYLMTGLMIAGAVWAARRYGLADRLRGMGLGQSDTALTDADRRALRGETIYRNTPSTSPADVSSLA